MNTQSGTLSPKTLFDAGLLYHHYANTAYPLTPSSFREFRIKDKSDIVRILKEQWSGPGKVNLYVHIPFCAVRCKFCEYTVLDESDEETEDRYVELLLKEIQMYRDILKDRTVSGYDLGGGTPTKLSLKNLRRITEAVKKSFNFNEQVTFSIETTPVIAAREPEKIKAVFEMGYERISMGVQTVSQKLLNELGREGATHTYEKAVQSIREAGFTKFNIDLMYGFLNQNNEDFENTLRYALSLNPDFITLYRNRYKGTKIEDEAGGVSLYKIMQQYRLAHTLLNENGYAGNPGKNTFSRIPDDYGTSDYLTERVIQGTGYVGMGLGAQSFGDSYLAYNLGAASKKMEQYRKAVEEGEFPFQDFYQLDTEEAIGKMVSVAFYFGFIDLEAFKKRFDLDFTEYFRDEVQFVLDRKLMEIDKGRIKLTPRGSDYINGIIPLFFSRRSKRELMDLIQKSRSTDDGEETFLKTYDISDFTRPSVTADIVLLKEMEAEKSVLLIKRGEHPFMNQWALPGGFLRPGETLDETARRELMEETGLSDIDLRQTGTYSDPGRDPRGWIISCAFTGVIKDQDAPLSFGEDAIDARWFPLKDLEKKQLAFDHAQIIKEAVSLK